VGASTDDTTTLARFQREEKAPQRFVSDPSGEITKAYGIAIEDSGKTYAGRVTFVIGTDGNVLHTVVDDVPESNVIKTYDWVKKHPWAKNTQ
jgi:peroxiredoxin